MEVAGPPVPSKCPQCIRDGGSGTSRALSVSVMEVAGPPVPSPCPQCISDVGTGTMCALTVPSVYQRWRQRVLLCPHRALSVSVMEAAGPAVPSPCPQSISDVGTRTMCALTVPSVYQRWRQRVLLCPHRALSVSVMEAAEPPVPSPCPQVSASAMEVAGPPVSSPCPQCISDGGSGTSRALSVSVMEVAGPAVPSPCP
ncbi:hypothetical protein NDU88_011588 [Pleurodeles waltl]|uniref:Uncharacterized protein n=1 Tax=Pleurodeles waltl TaxID=8319 RepID=A0AAV7PYV2_PLEWA|nr:hypothetical protein NDU88_011588 [Pleurodeles waltl]